jgi:hypothetical protein
MILFDVHASFLLVHRLMLVVWCAGPAREKEKWGKERNELSDLVSQ